MPECRQDDILLGPETCQCWESIGFRLFSEGAKNGGSRPRPSEAFFIVEKYIYTCFAPISRSLLLIWVRGTFSQNYWKWYAGIEKCGRKILYSKCDGYTCWLGGTKGGHVEHMLVLMHFEEVKRGRTTRGMAIKYMTPELLWCGTLYFLKKIHCVHI